MANYGPMIGKAGKLAVKYGPHVAAAAKVVGPKAKEIGQKKLDTAAERRKAFAKAGTLDAGAVWPLRHHDQRVFVVLAGDRLVESFPTVAVPLEELTRDADPAKIVTHAEWLEKKALTRAKNTAGAIGSKLPKKS